MARRALRADGAGRGVHLLTLHRAKGLEFDAVFLPRVEEKELPFRLARSPDEQAEERRLLYVGLTRAKRAARGHLERRSRAGSCASSASTDDRGGGAAPSRRATPDDPGLRALKAWRLERARADEVPRTSSSPTARSPSCSRDAPPTVAELAVGARPRPGRIGRFGEELYAVVLRAVAADGNASPSAHRASNGSAPIPPPSTPPPAHPEPDPAVYDALAAWRRRRAADEAMPAYHVFANRRARGDRGARDRARTMSSCACSGVGPVKLERYGDQALEVLATSVVRLPAVA